MHRIEFGTNLFFRMRRGDDIDGANIVGCRYHAQPESMEQAFLRYPVCSFRAVYARLFRRPFDLH